MSRLHLILLFIAFPALSHCEWKAYITTLSRGLSDEWWPIGVPASLGWRREPEGAIFFPSWDQRLLNSKRDDERNFETRLLPNFMDDHILSPWTWLTLSWFFDVFCHEDDHELGVNPSIPSWALPGVDALACVAGATITPTYLQSTSATWPKELAWIPWCF